MARLVLCPACAEFVVRTDRVCPHCNAVLADDRRGLVNATGAVLLGLSLAGCPAADDDDNTNTSLEPEYGVPATESTTVGMSSTTAGTTMSTTASTAGSETSTVGEPEYGVPETDSFTTEDSGGTGDSGTGTATGGTDTSTTIEPDYGLPDSG